MTVRGTPGIVPVGALYITFKMPYFLFLGTALIYLVAVHVQETILDVSFVSSNKVLRPAESGSDTLNADFLPVFF